MPLIPARPNVGYKSRKEKRERDREGEGEGERPKNTWALFEHGRNMVFAALSATEKDRRAPSLEEKKAEGRTEIHQKRET